jgi:PIN domain
MIVVFDTNIWKSHLYLQSPSGSAVRFFLRQKKARVGLPEVIKLEVEQHLKSDIQAAVSSIKSNHDRLLRIFGRLKEIVLPTAENVDSLIASLFSGLGVEILPVPFSLESARSSFLKIISKSPPSIASQQFKDGVLWADCLSLLNLDDVYLVSNDKAFYQDNNHSIGLAESLAVEITKNSHKIVLLPDLDSLLREIRVNPDFEPERLVDAFLASLKDGAMGLVSRNGFEIGKALDVRPKLFATEDPDRLFLEYTIRFECPDPSNLREPAILTVDGDGLYDTETKKFALSSLGEALKYQLSEGTEREAKKVIMRVGPIVFGHSEVSNKVREPLTE